MAASFVLVLSAHRPWLGREPDGVEEEWLLGALAGAYLPLVALLERLREEGLRAPVALAVSPTLTAMLDDALLKTRLCRRLADREALCGRLRPARPALDGALAFHEARFRSARAELEGSGWDLPARLRGLEDDGAVELLATTATHAVLPLVPAPEALAAQLRLAAREHERRFGRAAPGLWLPECGYDARVGPAAAACGFEHVFLEHHALEHARPRPRCGAYAPVRAPGGIFALGRDPETAPRPGSGLGPYGSPEYCDPNRDLSLELEPGGGPLGLYCHRTTGAVGLRGKEPYDPAPALAAARHAAEAFAAGLEARAARLSEELKTRPLLCAFYDAELFGHEWLEGGAFLETLLRRLARRDGPVAVRSPSWAIAHAAEAEAAEPEPSTWGPGGYLEAWLNDDNAWLAPHAHGVAGLMAELADRFGPRAESFPSPLEERALHAAARLALLAQASDWPFLVGARRHAAWAKGRFAALVAAFLGLREALEARAVDLAAVEDAERLAAVLPGADFRAFVA